MILVTKCMFDCGTTITIPGRIELTLDKYGKSNECAHDYLASECIQINEWIG